MSRNVPRLTIVAVPLAILLLSSIGHTVPAAGAPAAQTSCDTYGATQTTPPTNIRVRRVALGRVDVVDFKTYVKDVLAPEWPPNPGTAAYEAGALAVKTFGWYYVLHWEATNTLPGWGCYHVDDGQSYQVYVPGSSTTSTAFAVEQTWNWLLHSGDAIYVSQYRAGCGTYDPLCPDQTRTDGCGQLNLVGPPPGGQWMSQNGSKSCALGDQSWAQIVSSYYYANPTTPGDHTYGQWHGAMSWGPEPWKPVSVSGALWKFRNANSCGAPTISPFGFGNPADIKLVGDWDGNGTYTPGVARLVNGILWWYLNNGYDGSIGGSDYSFAYGQNGDIPIVGDWDSNLTSNVGVARGFGWFLEFSNPPQGPHDILLNYGLGGDTPVPGKWKSQSANQATTPGVFRLETNGAVRWYIRYSNQSGGGEFDFGYGDPTDRPIAGNYRSGDLDTQFGPGVVRDDSTASCGGMSHNQGWYLRYTPSTGTANVSYKYELVRP